MNILTAASLLRYISSAGAICSAIYVTEVFLMWISQQQGGDGRNTLGLDRCFHSPSHFELTSSFLITHHPEVARADVFVVGNALGCIKRLAQLGGPAEDVRISELNGTSWRPI